MKSNKHITSVKIDETPLLTEQKMAHKTNKENVFIDNLIEESGALNNGFQYQYKSNFKACLNHSFFFEHERNHIPGLMLIEAGRQNSLIISHKFLKVPIHTSFIMNNISFDFFKVAHLYKSIKVYTSVEVIKNSKNRIIEYIHEAYMIQNENEIAKAKGSFMVLPNTVLKKLEA